MDIDQILSKLEELRDSWYATEDATGKVVWGECAYDLDTLIKKLKDSLPDSEIVLEGKNYNVHWVDAYTVSLTRCR